MYDKDKRSFFERLTGTMNIDEETEFKEEVEENNTKETTNEAEKQNELFEEKDENNDTNEQDDNEISTNKPQVNHDALPYSKEEGELAVDVYEDPTHIYVQAMIAGVEPDEVDISITREMVTLRGKRINPKDISDENYYHKELYWGGFSRKILLPEEIDPENSKALEKHGLLVLKLPKLNKKKSQKLEVKSIE